MVFRGASIPSSFLAGKLDARLMRDLEDLVKKVRKTGRQSERTIRIDGETYLATAKLGSNWPRDMDIHLEGKGQSQFPS